MNLRHHLRDLTRQLRATSHGQVVTVTITGSPSAAVTVTRALATVVHLTAIRHIPTANSTTGGTIASIRLDAVCHLATGRQP